MRVALSFTYNSFGSSLLAPPQDINCTLRPGQGGQARARRPGPAALPSARRPGPAGLPAETTRYDDPIYFYGRSTFTEGPKPKIVIKMFGFGSADLFVSAPVVKWVRSDPPGPEWPAEACQR